MSDQKNRYIQMQWYMTYALIADLGMFLLYLIFSGFGIIWLKVITAIFVILISLLCLGLLYLTRELTTRRSFWMTTAAGAMLICLLASLIFNCPRPNTYKIPEKESQSTVYYSEM